MARVLVLVWACRRLKKLLGDGEGGRPWVYLANEHHAETHR